jgi:predicted transcriptional regulator
MVEKIKNIYSLLSEGKSYSQISKELNISKSLVAFYAKKSENSSIIKKIEEKEKQKEEYEKLICSLSQECSNLNQICRMLNKRSTNKNYEYILNILKKHNVEISSLKIDKIINRPKLLKEDIFCLNSKLKNNSSLREKLFKYALKEHKCEMCGNTHWYNNEIPLELHHINGVKTDNRIENLQLLCPNCHALTDNYRGKNIGMSAQKETFEVEAG